MHKWLEDEILQNINKTSEVIEIKENGNIETKGKKAEDNVVRKIHPFRRFVIIYTILFALALLSACTPWIVAKTSFIWNIDGVNQHYPALVYLGKYIRETVNGFSKGIFHLNMWDIRIGLGSDIIGTMNYYCMGDPLDLIAGLVPTRDIEYVYDALIVLRMYLAGMAFAAYAFYKKEDYKAVTFGSLVYVFSGYVLVYGVKHPLFINPMIYLPIIFVGIDKILKKEKSLLFTIMVTIALVSNFYFFYIISIAIFIYAIWRVKDLYSENIVMEYLQAIKRSILFYLLGIACACVIFIPVVCSFLATSRSGTRVFPSLFYSKGYYEWLPLNSVALGTLEGQTNLGYVSTFMILFLALLTVKNKKCTPYRIFFILSVVGLTFPMVGFGMTGFSYVANRWGFLLTFVIAMGSVRCMELWDDIKLRHLILPMTFEILGIVLVLKSEFLPLNGKYSIRVVAVGCAVVLLAKLVRLKAGKILYVSLSLLLIVEVGVKMMSFFYWEDKVAESQFVKADEAYNETSIKAINKIKEEDKSLYRVECMCDNTSNYGLINDIPTVSSYYSITQGNFSDTMEKLGNADTFTAAWTYGFSRRTGMLNLAGVKYFIANDLGGDLKSVPYGFTKTDEVINYKENGQEERQSIYKTDNYIPMVYGYNKTIGLNEWERMSEYDREEAIQQAAVMDLDVDTSDLNLKSGKVNLDSKVVLNKQQILEQVANSGAKNIAIEDDKIIIKWGGVFLRLNYEGLPNSETYLVMKNIDYTLLDKDRLKEIKEEVEALPDDEKANIEVNPGTDTFWLGGNINDLYAGLKFCTKYYIYPGCDSAVCNLGYSDEPVTTSLFYMMAPGVYDFEDLSLVCNPMNTYKSQVDDLRVKVKGLKIKNDKLSCSVDLKEDKILCLAIPYSKGWSAKVDGEKVEAFEINGMYTGLKLKAGKHDIEMNYFTPGLKLGLIISLIGVAILIYLLFDNKRKKDKKEIISEEVKE